MSGRSQSKFNVNGKGNSNIMTKVSVRSRVRSRHMGRDRN